MAAKKKTAKKTAKKTVGKKQATVSKKSDNNDSKTFAFLAVFLSIIGFVIALLAKREDKYVMFYAKESLALFLVSLGLNIIGWILSIVTLGLFIFVMPLAGLVIFLLWIVILVLWIIQIVNSFSGEEKSTPIVGGIAKYFKF